MQRMKQWQDGKTPCKQNRETAQQENAGKSKVKLHNQIVEINRMM